ncbi:MAG: hypothetical protein A2X64_03615 [Ignavibacteria bacterium GWF2_33_9]|nr:MAG: hypothetical protein A2X64_03615 [Ignavibacteria bacterium GWF2_33_9]
MPDLETNSQIYSPNVQIALEKFWEITRKLLRQVHFQVEQNKELSRKLSEAGHVHLQDWIELDKYNVILQERDDLQKHNEILRSEISELQKLTEDSLDSSNYKKIIEENSELQNSLIELQNIRSQLSEKQMELLSKNNIISDLKSQVNINQKKIEESSLSEIKIETLERDNKQLIEQVEQKEQELSEKIWIINEFENSLNEKTSSLKSLQEELIKYESKEQNDYSLFKQKTEEFDDLRNEKEILETELTKIKIENRKLAKQIEDKKKSNVTLFDTENIELEHFKKENDKLNKKIEELTLLNTKFKNEILNTKSGLLPLNFGDEDDSSEKITLLEIQLANQRKNQKIFENKLVILENSLILKIEEIAKFEKLVEQNKEEVNLTNNKIKSKLLDLKKFLIDKGII